MALLITGIERSFIFKNGGSEITLNDPNQDLTPEEVMDYFSMTYPELTTATVFGPELESDKAVYRFKTTLGTKG